MNDLTYDRWNILLEDNSFRFVILEEESGRVVASYIEGMDLNTAQGFAENKYLYRRTFPCPWGTRAVPLKIST